MKKGSVWFSIIRHKCARCHEASLFEDPNPYNLSKLFGMHDHCPHCGQKHEIEIGFWWGAMYIAYFLSSFELLASFAVLAFIGGLEIMTSLYLSMGVGFLLAPYVFRTSRAIWLNFFVHYDKEMRWESEPRAFLLSDPTTDLKSSENYSNSNR